MMASYADARRSVVWDLNAQRVNTDLLRFYKAGTSKVARVFVDIDSPDGHPRYCRFEVSIGPDHGVLYRLLSVSRRRALELPHTMDVSSPNLSTLLQAAARVTRFPYTQKKETP